MILHLPNLKGSSKGKLFKMALLSVFVLAFPFFHFGQTTETFTSDGTWTVPCGVTSVTIHVYGAGGGGGGSNDGGVAGGGGGGGGYATSTAVTVSPGQMIDYLIGAGGAGGGASFDGSAGGNTTWDTGGLIGTIVANGGGGGIGSDGDGGPSGSGGTAGTSSGGTTSNQSGLAGSAGGATFGGDGGSNPGPDGGGLGQGGGEGSAGNSGQAFGGGGGGSGDKAGSSNPSGGAGANGGIVIEYTTSVTQPNAGVDISTCNAITLSGNTPDALWCATWTVLSGPASVTSPGSCPTNADPNSAVTGLASGDCSVIEYTFSQAGCPSLTDQVTVCVPGVCNDEPCEATALTVQTLTSCPSPAATETTVGATYSTGMVDPPCGYVNGDQTGPDVWYSAVVPADGQLQVSALGSGGFDAMVSIYDGPCNDLSSAGCTAPNTFASQQGPLTYVGTPGSTIYIRINESLSGDAATGTFGVCAYTTNTGTVSQVLPGDTTTIACGGTLNFYDPGGQGGSPTTSTANPVPAGNYTNNTGAQWTICPDSPTEFVRIDFNQFALESGFDKVIVLANDTVIAQWTGTAGAGGIVTSQAAGECITVVLQADYSFSAMGWEAVVSCTTAAFPPEITNGCEVRNCNEGCGVWICEDGVYDTAAGAGAGIDEINEVTGGCWGAAGEIATSWFYFTTATGGELAFEFVPSNNGHNINFALYGPSTDGVPPCPLLTGDAPVRCSFATGAGINTGLQSGQTDLYDPATGDGMSAPLTVGPGETYALVVDVYQNGSPPTETEIDFTGAVQLDCTPVYLPVSLQEFSGVNMGDRNLLTWITSSEVNSSYFVVQRSKDGKEWEEVGRRDAAGNSNNHLYYQMYDSDFYPISYYRLVQFDIDGESSKSEIVTIGTRKDLEGDLVSSLFPNPAEEFTSFTYNFHDAKTPMNVEVLDATGAVVEAYEFENLSAGETITLKTTELANGMYQVIFTQGEKRAVRKLSLLR